MSSSYIKSTNASNIYQYWQLERRLKYLQFDTKQNLFCLYFLWGNNEKSDFNLTKSSSFLIFWDEWMLEKFFFSQD
jgi:hypothetical protein